ncbi:short chain dehydrogenase domain-containing protein [Ditylenchus destructor]|nr:short chain dehydrogenase domain-containing protein [Ditylenchus destructor]
MSEQASSSKQSRRHGSRMTASEAKGIVPKIDILQLDLSSLESVRRAADEFILKGWPLHILILNAGLTSLNGELSVDGYERTFAVNHLGHFYLSILLMKKLRESAPSRLVVVSSLLHAKTGIRPNKSLNEKLQKLLTTPSSRPTMLKDISYNNSKLCNVLFAKKVHRMEHSNGVNVYVLHPGIIATGLAREQAQAHQRLFKFVACLLSSFGKTIEQGAATTVYCAASPEIANESGRYYCDCAAADNKLAKELADDEEFQDALWEQSLKMIANFQDHKN